MWGVSSAKMIKTLISDLSYVLLFPVDKTYDGKINTLYTETSGGINFKFIDFFRLNTDLLEFYKSLKIKGMKLYIFTEGSIQNDPEIKQKLDDVFVKGYSVDQVGFAKSDVESYRRLLQMIGIEPSQVMYVDDKAENIEAASEAGLQAILYKNNEEVIGEVNKLLEGNV